MQNAFDWWIGQQAVLQIAFGQIKVSLRGMLLRVETETLLIRPEAGSDVEIAKTRILAIEEVGAAPAVSYSLPLNEFSQRKVELRRWVHSKQELKGEY
jgi:hypothetical protein